MITVTERAKEELKAMLIAVGANSDKGLRLLPRPDGRFELMLDTELSGDLVVEYQGCKVLLIGIEYFKILDGAVIDCHHTEEEAILFVQKYVDS